LTPNEIHCT
jgi:hypothetical protein